MDIKTNKFVGYVNINKNTKTEKATMGIEIKADFQGNGYMRPAIKELIKETQRQKVDVLTDTVPNTRTNALKVFFELGFKKVQEFQSKKFNNNETVYEIELPL